MILILLLLSLLLNLVLLWKAVSLRKDLRLLSKDLADLCDSPVTGAPLLLPSHDKSLSAFVLSVNEIIRKLREEGIRAKKKERLLKEQFENISHDLRTPLTVLLGHIKLRKTNLADTSELSETLSLAEKKAEALKELVACFQELSELEGEDFFLPLSPLDATRSTKEFLADAYPLLAASSLEVKTDLPDRPLFISGNEKALTRIFQNLLQNTLRYGKSEFSLSLKEEDAKVILSFTNDSTSLSETDLPFLFERSFTGDRSRASGGKGLGLSIAKTLAEKMGGSLHAVCQRSSSLSSSETALFVSFRLTFPLLSEHNPKTPDSPPF